MEKHSIQLFVDDSLKCVVEERVGEILEILNKEIKWLISLSVNTEQTD